MKIIRLGIRHIHNNNLIETNNSITTPNKNNKVSLDSVMLNKEGLDILHIIQFIKLLMVQIITPKKIDKMAIHFKIKIKLKVILTLLEITIDNLSLEDRIILHLNQELSCK